MLKVLIIYLALCFLTHAVYISRLSPSNRITAVNRVRSPTAFRPGVNLQSLQTVQRPWTYGSMRFPTVASDRAPYVLYRNQPQRYVIKHYGPSSHRNIFTHSPWKTTARLPAMSSFTSQYEFVKPASAAQFLLDSDGGAIHTIPAPNLGLSEKPIVVLETSVNPISEKAKPSYEVTEKYPDGEYNTAKIQPPVGFSKKKYFTRPALQNLIRNGGAEYSFPSLSFNQHHRLAPQQFHMQNFNNLPSPQDLIHTGTEEIFVPPDALYQSDPMFLQKLQGQLMQRFPALEFIPYAPDMTYQGHLQPQQQASQNHPQIVSLENEQLDKPLAIHVPKQSEEIETQESTVVTLSPQAFTALNTTVKQIEETTPQQPQNITLEPVAVDSQPLTTTIKYGIETNTEEQNTTPIYYAQVGQSVGSVIANGFYSAINDVRAAAAMAQEKASEATPTKTTEDKTTTTTTTTIPDLKADFVKSEDKSENKTTTELKPVNVASTLLRPDDKQSKVNEEGAVYAGQIVEATISEDQDFNKEKKSLISKRAPIRLFAIAGSNNISSASNTASIPEVTVVKAKIPAKSKLTFDDKTGEPILRIYASYVDTPSQKDAIIAKLSTLKPNKDSIIKRDLAESWKGATVKSTAKTQGSDANQGTQFGLKLKQRSDDYIPLFEDYDD
ncbi:unnamed protein product [Arctia plantaginis]|nr:unnamed protein product [Arctia plantaginis]